ncbi:MAG: acetyl-CoA acetyltransferase, acetyl-CoA C-acetyltransferase [candidate division NC10 bacterium CSP1-5]|nr:MAG: acetyl-CoA acetyltransferase, acetyl-CoA C-acetyltransferase [candidate division NC10 bacterium CSP1-5]
MEPAVIVSAVRTPIGTFGGALKETPATKLGAVAVAEAVKRAHLAPDQIGEVIVGNILQAGLGLNPARVAALEAGIPIEVPSYTINKACGSSIKAVILGAQSILLGEADIVVAGGMESMSTSPYLLRRARWGQRLGHGQVEDTILADGLTCPITSVHMGVTAEQIARKYGISREEQDRFAVRSQEKAQRAIKDGKFEGEIVPVQIPQPKGDQLMFAQDEHPRDTTLEKMARLKPAFQEGGTVTAGNASGINDGASAVVVTSMQKARKLGLKPLGAIRSWASAGVDPSFMGMGPVPACRKALERAELKPDEIDLYEIHEAFAAQVLGVLREFPVPEEKLNIHGGGIALGHPIGASGARILTTLLYALHDRGGRYGLATGCIGGGQGIAMVVERLETL